MSAPVILLLVLVALAALGAALAAGVWVGCSSLPDAVLPVAEDLGGEPTPSAEPTGPARADEPAEPDTSAARLEHALDSIEQGVVIFDASGAVLYSNAAADRFSEARDPLVLVQAALREMLSGALLGATERREVELFGPPAQSFVVTVQPYTVHRDADEDTEPGLPSPLAGALAVIEDRSLQRRVETVRRDFVANISHELKTPIGALGLLAETIRDEPDSEVVERLAERMITEADRAGRTVDDLLELSRIEFGDEAEFEDVALLSVIGEANARIASAAEHAGIQVHIDVPPTHRVHGDRRQLVSAIFNLLDNAVKYSTKGDEVVVTSSASSRPGHVQIEVADTGIGIPRRDLDRVFERFYRVDRARSRVTGGTGLGLAIVRHVMSNHGGEVELTSTEGVGSTFTLTLPGET